MRAARAMGVTGRVRDEASRAVSRVEEGWVMSWDWTAHGGGQESQNHEEGSIRLAATVFDAATVDPEELSKSTWCVPDGAFFGRPVWPRLTGGMNPRCPTSRGWSPTQTGYPLCAASLGDGVLRSRPRRRDLWLLGAVCTSSRLLEAGSCGSIDTRLVDRLTSRM